MSFFEASKILGFFVEPLNALFALLIVAMLCAWFGRARAAGALVTIVVIAFAMIVFVPLDSWLLLPLEQRFPAPKNLPAKIDGIIMLGGAQRPRLTAAWGQPSLNGAAERMTTFVALARRYPAARLVFSGGSGDILHQDVGESDTVRLFLKEQGIDPARMIYETRSRNTWENARNSFDLVRPKPGEIWLLINSAADLPRAVGVFRNVGWAVVPWPCDYNALPAEWAPRLGLTSAMSDLNHALHEWIGLLVYYLTEKIDSAFPGP